MSYVEGGGYILFTVGLKQYSWILTQMQIL